MPYLNKQPPDPEPMDCRILNTALDLFVTNGYHNVSVHDVQKQASVSIGSIYKYFGGKEGIAKSLYERLIGEVDEMIDDITEEHESAKDRSEAIIRKLFEYVETHTHIIAYVFHSRHTEFITDELPIGESSPFQKMQHIVQQGIDDGEFRNTNITVATACVFGGAIRMLHQRLDGIIKEPLSSYVDEVVESTWQGVCI